MKTYTIQLHKHGRWVKTLWTRLGNAVQLRGAKKALVKAQTRFPNAEFRIRERQ